MTRANSIGVSSCLLLSAVACAFVVFDFHVAAPQSGSRASTTTEPAQANRQRSSSADRSSRPAIAARTPILWHKFHAPRKARRPHCRCRVPTDDTLLDEDVAGEDQNDDEPYLLSFALAPTSQEYRSGKAYAAAAILPAGEFLITIGQQRVRFAGRVSRQAISLNILHVRLQI